MIPLLAVMLGAYIVSRCCDTIARRSPSRFTEGLSVLTAIVAAGLAIICTALIVREGQAAADVMRGLLP